jgi:TolB protein
MNYAPHSFLLTGACIAAVSLLTAQAPSPQPPSEQPTQPTGQTELVLSITGEPGAPPHYAVPDFVALTLDKETVDAGKLLAEVLWADLAFEREFDMIPRDTYGTIEQTRTTETINFDRWRELGADGVVKGSVRRTGNTFQVEIRLFNVRGRGVALGRVYDNVSVRNPRFAAHTMADDIHQSQSNLRGVARTKLTFVSDRDNERIVDTIEPRNGKEIYVMDYDGANQVRVTSNRRLNILPTWSPDSRSIAYSSYARVHPQIIVSNIYQGTREALTDDKSSALMPVYSPDGSKIAFMSQRDENSEIYVMNRDGSNVRRLTKNNAADSTPTWSPTGTQIAFTSDRSGSPQIWVMDTDGLNVRRITLNESWADRATWSPAPYNEIAFSARTGPGFDVKIFDVATGATRIITDGIGTNESPAFSPSGRHIAFSSTRFGKVQIFTIARDGNGLKQVTRVGNNTFPNWSR